MVRVPRKRRNISMEAKLHAGPATRRTRAAPGVRPFIINATAMGMLPVAQRYMGMEMKSTRSMLARVLSLKKAKYSVGMTEVIIPAITRPTTSHLPMSSIIST